MKNCYAILISFLLAIVMVISQQLIAQAETNPAELAKAVQEIENLEEGIRYYRRINVEASCLACHGGKNSRPEFIKQKYPQDLAYDFKEGDLRGMYAVFIPKLKKALQKNMPTVEVNQ